MTSFLVFATIWLLTLAAMSQGQIVAHRRSTGTGLPSSEPQCREYARSVGLPFRVTTCETGCAPMGCYVEDAQIVRWNDRYTATAVGLNQSVQCTPSQVCVRFVYPTIAGRVTFTNTTAGLVYIFEFVGEGCFRPQKQPGFHGGTTAGVRNRLRQSDFRARFPLVSRLAGATAAGVSGIESCAAMTAMIGGGGFQYLPRSANTTNVNSGQCALAPPMWANQTPGMVPNERPPNGGIYLKQAQSCGGGEAIVYSLVSVTPVQPTNFPSAAPTHSPTTRPSAAPSVSSPTDAPSATPTSSRPTLAPSWTPTRSPLSSAPTTPRPSQAPTNAPTLHPTPSPTPIPTMEPSRLPSVLPSSQPTKEPTTVPSRYPSVFPTRNPTTSPSYPVPTEMPSTSTPTSQPTYGNPTMMPVLSSSTVSILSSTTQDRLAVSFFHSTYTSNSIPPAVTTSVVASATIDDESESPGRTVGWVVGTLVFVAVVGIALTHRARPSTLFSCIKKGTTKNATSSTINPAETSPETKISDAALVDLNKPRDPISLPATVGICPPVTEMEFEALPKNSAGLEELPEGIPVKPLNRYKNVLPNKNSRVVLPMINNDATSSYINANHVAGIDQCYIACQGPVPQSVVSFWRMLWLYDVRIVIMTTALEEKGKSKCTRYWPDVVSRAANKGIVKYGNVAVRVLKAQQLYGYKIAVLEASVGKQNPRIITHFWCDSWEDYGISNPETIIDMLNNARGVDTSGNPWVVHCSAGIGRTGTCIGIDIGMRFLNKHSGVDTTAIVSALRLDRGGMVQTYKQYAFMHDVLSHYHEEKLNAKNKQTTGDETGDEPSNKGSTRTLSLHEVEPYYVNVSLKERRQALENQKMYADPLETETDS